MFNKSIVVALILCACYLSVSQANVVSALAIPVHGIDATDKLSHDVQNAAGLSGAGLSGAGLSGAGSGLPVVGDVLSGGGPKVPGLDIVGK